MDRVLQSARFEMGKGAVMLRINVVDEPFFTTLELEGRLVCDWIPEAHRAWSEASRNLTGKQLVVDLSELTFADDLGRDLLSLMHASGAKLVGSGAMVSGLIKEIEGEPASESHSEFVKLMLFLVVLVLAVIGMPSDTSF